MTDADIDLIRAAGKAAGLTLQLALGFTERDRGLFTAEGKEWNPLTDDGDAFRLAVALRLSILPFPDGEEVCVQAHGEFSDWVEPTGTDPAAATRRAIVRAAAAHGGA